MSDIDPEQSALDAHAGWLADLQKGLADVRSALAEQHRVVDELRLHGQVAAVTAWLEHVEQPEVPLISVILPTRNRGTYLPGAIASVHAQSHRNWQLVVVDDGSTDDTPEVLASLADDRMRTMRIEPSGASEARNRGLEAANGELIAYLDDDNLLHPHWLRAVAWAFDRAPGCDFLYGARVLEDTRPLVDQQADPLPRLQIEPFERSRLQQHNYIDTGAIAHRAGLPEARFDATRDPVEDWDLVLRLSRDGDPLVLPAIACLYRTLHAGRVSELRTPGDEESMRAAARAEAGA